MFTCQALIMADKVWYEWRVLHTGDGKTPNVRINTSSWLYKDQLWVVCGSGSGLGKSSEVWKFNVAEKSWNRVTCSGEPPSCRDGHTGTHIGNGKFVIFGGQGFPEPNLKLGKESETMKTKTYNKREVYNDLMIFNCDTAHWSPLYPDGLSVPMGRRAHTAVHIPAAANSAAAGARESFSADGFDASSVVSGSTYQSSVHAGLSVGSPSAPSSMLRAGYAGAAAESDKVSAIPSNSLLVFGGVGIELSKYTEQLYNELWAFSFDSNTWIRQESRGVEPRPMYDHKMEWVDDSNLLVLGGITAPSKVPAAAFHTSPYSDVMLFNIRTVTWSYLKIYDMHGRPERFNFHGFAIAADRTSDEHSGKFYIFGGRQVVDSKYAATAKSLSIDRPCDGALTLVLNAKEGTLLPLDIKFGGVPEDRYGHVGVCASTNIDNLVVPNSNYPGRSGGGANGGSGAGAGFSGGGASQKRKEGSRSRSIRNSFFDASPEVQHAESLMFVFGGCAIEGPGFCDPLLHQLVRVTSTGSSDGLKLPDLQGASINSATPLVTHVNDPPADMAAAAAAAAAAFTASAGQLLLSQVVQVGFKDGEDIPSRPGSPQLYDADAFGLLAGNQSSSFCSSVGLRGSIWNNLQNKPSDKEKNPREPANWSELKLALTRPISQRTYLNTPDDAPSSRASSALGEARGSARGQRAASAPTYSSFVAEMENSFAPGSMSLARTSATAPVGDQTRGGLSKRSGRCTPVAALTAALPPSKPATAMHTAPHMRPKSVAFSPIRRETALGGTASPGRNEISMSRLRNAGGMIQNINVSNNSYYNSGSIPTLGNSQAERRPYTAPAFAGSPSTLGSDRMASSGLMEEEDLMKQMRLKTISDKLKPVMHHKKSKVEAKKEFLKMFPHTMHHVPMKR